MSAPFARQFGGKSMSAALQARSLCASGSRSTISSSFPAARIWSSRAASTAARPSARYRPELPKVPDRRPLFLLAALIALGSWSTFASYATNKERLSSSVFRSVLIQLKDDPQVRAALGDPVMLEPSIWGDPWVKGSVNMMQGRVDMSFKLRGSRDTGNAYFTSIRRDQSRSFEVLRFLVITESGDTISLLPDGQSAVAVHDADGELEFGPRSAR